MCRGFLHPSMPWGHQSPPKMMSPSASFAGDSLRAESSLTGGGSDRFRCRRGSHTPLDALGASVPPQEGGHERALRKLPLLYFGAIRMPPSIRMVSAFM